MDRNSGNKKGVSLFSKLMLCVVLAVGMVVILMETDFKFPVPVRHEKTAAHTEEPAREEKVYTQPEETEAASAETQPAGEEAVPETAEPAKPAPVTGSRGPVEYEIVRWDRSYTNAEGRPQMTYYYDYPVIHSDEQAHRQINDALYSKAEAFMTEKTQEQIETPVMSVFNTPTDCIYTIEAEVCHNGDGIFSVLYTSDYYMGGNTSIKNRHAATYSLETGEEMDLLQLTGMDEETLLRELRTRAYDGFGPEANPMLFDDAKERLERYGLDRFRFLIQDGEVILLFDSYEFTSGAAGPWAIPTGLYISKN